MSAERATQHAHAFRGTAAVAVDGREAWSLQRLIDTDGGRWSRPDEPTIYLAGDPGVALVEFGRHHPGDAETVGSIWELLVEVDAVDLRDLPDDAVLDQERCRAIASRWRRKGAAALVVPSAGCLDQRDRFNIVVFAEVIGERVDEVISRPRLLATVGAGASTDVAEGAGTR